MSLISITFSIFDESKRKACQAEIMKNEHVQINDASFIIKSSTAIEILRRDLAEYFDKQDKMFIAKISKQHTSFHLGKKTRDWIEENV